MNFATQCTISPLFLHNLSRVFINYKNGYLPAPLSLTKTCSDIVILDDLLADLKDEYNTQTIQTIKPIMLSLSNPIWVAPAVVWAPTIPNKPGLQLESTSKVCFFIYSYNYSMEMKSHFYSVIYLCFISEVTSIQFRSFHVICGLKFWISHIWNDKTDKSKILVNLL